ncbi:MAG TPA: DUF305 domain-containing protein [Mycobacteriales bacterium]
MATLTDAPPTRAAPRGVRALTVLLVAVMGLALFVAGGALAVVSGIGADRPPAEDSVDAGFARDMSTHHAQAVVMAQRVRDHGTDPAVRLLAYDIETGQLAQIGQMRGWLQTWGLTPQSSLAPMSWTGHEHEGRMPGMATTAELARLDALSGRALDVYFLQLMIRHHQGGLEMAQYGAAHASESYVRDLASKIVAAQQAEVVTMEQLLRQRGGRPL